MYALILLLLIPVFSFLPSFSYAKRWHALVTLVFSLPIIAVLFVGAYVVVTRDELVLTQGFVMILIIAIVGSAVGLFTGRHNT